MSETTSGSVTWLTQDAYDRKKEELEHLSGPVRAELVKRIEAAREEGDLKENAGYHAAKEDQGKLELRIRQLRQLLETARVGEAEVDASGAISPGVVVTVDLAGDEVTFLLGSREMAGDSDIDVYSERSPLGAAILGRKPGDAVSYTAPNGRQIPVTIKDAKPYTG
ncbi:transcription elongation factor GreA [Kineococcus glutinatus]|uniref:Transcription elongation factor GreA n=1 Tax=Kineococcus glutinatus TaxID=1070872 RepID=A0ABP8VF44_9ACTN